jgi:hypothetical protein
MMKNLWIKKFNVGFLRENYVEGYILGITKLILQLL